jgi:hypothetical protein
MQVILYPARRRWNATGVQYFKEQNLYQGDAFRCWRDALFPSCLSAISLRQTVRIGISEWH